MKWFINWKTWETCISENLLNVFSVLTLVATFLSFYRVGPPKKVITHFKKRLGVGKSVKAVLAFAQDARGFNRCSF